MTRQKTREWREGVVGGEREGEDEIPKRRSTARGATDVISMQSP